MSKVIEELIKGKPRLRNKHVHWMDAYIYLLQIEGDDAIFFGDKYKIIGKDMTEASATIWDSATERLSVCGVHRDQKGTFIKKNGLTYRIDKFIVENEEKI